MTPSLKPGMTFQFDDRAGDDHLYVVVSSPSHPEVVIVSLTTKRRFTDTSCELGVGDHPFIQHASCIAYEFAETISTETLQRKIDDHSIRVRDPMSLEIIGRILDGAERTRNLPNRCSALLRLQGLIA
jgi:hypothetical protein